MKDVTVCIVVNNEYYSTRYCIENLLNKTDSKPTINICNTNTTDDRIETFCEEICKEFKGVYIKNNNVNLSDCYNQLLEHSKTHYTCIFPINVLVSKFWLEDLIYNYVTHSTIPGILSIRNGHENLKLHPVLYENYNRSEHEIHNVWMGEIPVVEGLMFFATDHLDKIGKFNVDINLNGYLQQEFCFRFVLNNLKSYYIRKQTLFKIQSEDKFLFPNKTKESFILYKNIIEDLVKLNKYERAD